MSLATLKNLNMDRVIDLEEAVALSAEARQLEGEFSVLGIPAPDWLEKSAAVVREEIARRTRASKLARLKEVEAGIEATKTAAERRGDLQRELAGLQKELGMVPAKAGK